MSTLSAEKLGTWTGRLIDVRTYEEYATEHVERAECVPLDRLAATANAWERGEPLLMICKSGMRSGQAAEQLKQMGFANVTLLSGGIEACKGAGIPVIRGRRQIPVFRQVMAVAGVLLLAGLALAYVSPWFILIDWFVACGLIVGGLTGFCPMALLLGRMPWNRASCCSAGPK